MIGIKGDPRYTSRKWRLTIAGIILYTAIHLVNAGAVLVCLNNEWLNAASATTIWTSSLTIWSGGMIWIMGQYLIVNATQNIKDRRNG